MTGTHRNAARAALLRLLFCLSLFEGVGVWAAPESEEFLYHAQPQDTLIGLGRRLLLEPQRWREVQTLNHIANPRRIPLGSILRIPYAWLRLNPETATVVSVAGTVEQSGTKIAPGEALPQGSVIATGADGSVTIDLADGSVVTVQKSSVLKLDEMVQVAGAADARSIRLKLDAGRVETKVKPHRDVGRFEIITPVAVSAVRGTQFRDGYTDTDGRATAETLEGTVNVNASAASVAVVAGFGTRVEKDQPPLPPVALLPPPRLSDLEETNTTAQLRVQLPPVPGAEKYRVQLSTDETFHALTADVVTADGRVGIADLSDGDYWLRARSIDPLGIEGADAVKRLRQHVLPAPPAPAAPASNAKITGTPIRFSWTSASASPSYRLQVASDTTFDSPVIERARLDTMAAEVEDLPPGRYVWRVAAVNALGETGPWSDAQAFTERAPMPAPDIPHREGKRWTFRWRSVPDETYRAQIAREPDFRAPTLDQRMAAAEWSVPKLFPGVYFLRVQSIDPDGSAGPFSAPRRFTVPIPLWVKIAAPLAVGLAFLL